MSKAATTIAEARFAAARKKAKQVLSEVEKQRQEVDKRTARLRELRLAKEAAEKEAADEAAAAKPAPRPKPKTPTKPKRTPRTY